MKNKIKIKIINILKCATKLTDFIGGQIEDAGILIEELSEKVYHVSGNIEHIHSEMKIEINKSIIVHCKRCMCWKLVDDNDEWAIEHKLTGKGMGYCDHNGMHMSGEIEACGQYGKTNCYGDK